MEATRTLLTFERGDQSADHIQSVVDEVMAELGDPATQAAQAALAAGLDPVALGRASVEVREGGQGAEPILTTIVVGIAVQAGSKVAETLWREVLWPRLSRRLGKLAVGPGRDAE
jgi:hypothetical protein